MIFVATAFWCEETWVIAAGHDKAAVVRDADAYMLAHPSMFTAAGHFKYPDANGRCAEGYIVEQVEESK